MERREFLISGAASVGGMSAQPAQSQSAPTEPWAPSDLETAVVRLRKQFSSEFDPAYVENVIIPSFLIGIYVGERQFLPMIDVNFTKENALPYDLWGLLSESWKPAPQDGVTVCSRGVGETGAA
jgi:hypothetical protein